MDDKERQELRDFVGTLNRQPFTFKDVADAIYDKGYRRADIVRKETAREVLQTIYPFTDWTEEEYKANAKYFGVEVE